MALAVRTRVVKGEGVFHAHKVKYNRETHQLLRGNTWISGMKCWNLS